MSIDMWAGIIIGITGSVLVLCLVLVGMTVANAVLDRISREKAAPR